MFSLYLSIFSQIYQSFFEHLFLVQQQNTHVFYYMMYLYHTGPDRHILLQEYRPVPPLPSPPATCIIPKSQIQKKPGNIVCQCPRLFITYTCSYSFILHDIRQDSWTAISRNRRTSHRFPSQLPSQVLPSPSWRRSNR